MSSTKTPFGLYEEKPGDKVTIFNDESGFSVLSDYKENAYLGMKMLIKIAFSREVSGAVIGSVNMVEFKLEEGSGYPVTDATEGKLRVTNFNFGVDEEIVFDKASNEFRYKKRPKSLDVTQFVDLLADNHQHQPQPLQILERKVPALVLRIFFWLIDLNYEKDAGVIELLGVGVNEGKLKFTNKDLEPDPFFKYFKISKNLLLVALVVTIVAMYIAFRNFGSKILKIDVTNWFLLVVATATLLFLEKMNSRLVKYVRAFKEGERNFIYRLHARKFGWFGRKFDLYWR